MSGTRLGVLATVWLFGLLLVPAARADDVGVTVRSVPNGVEVMGVTPKSLAAQLDLTRANVIETVNKRLVRTQQELEEAMSAKRERHLILGVRRSGRLETIHAEIYWPPNRPGEPPRPPIVLKKKVEP